MTIDCLRCHTPVPDGSKYCPECGAATPDPTTGGVAIRPGATDTLLVRLREVVAERYEVRRLLGRGGMGAVFLATDRALDRDVALKVLPTELSHDEKCVMRFEHEARTAAKLDHNNIIPIYAVESRGELHYFVMKYVTGRSLDDIVKAGPLPVDAAQRILWEAAVALGHAHQRRVVHRDIKPANIMIDDSGRAMLTDFGISKAIQSASQFTATGQVIGTPHYMSPEQAKGADVDGRSDQYSLGVVGYRMLAGRLPFEDDSVHTVIYKHIFEQPPPLEDFRPEAPPHVITALNRAMAKSPADRFPTMEAFASATLPEQPVTGPSRPITISTARGTAALDVATQLTPPPRPPRRRRRAAVVGLLVLAGAAGGGYWYVSRDGRIATATAGGADTLTVAPVVPTPTRPEPRPTDPTPVQTRRQEPERRPPPRREPETPPAPTVGYLTIDARPWGTVFVDGIEIQDTPLVRHELRPGRHIIEVRREGYRTVIDTVQISAGNSTRLTKTLVSTP